MMRSSTAPCRPRAIQRANTVVAKAAGKSGKIKKVVLAYSGGLDTSIILKWLQDEYGCEVITFTADLGQVREIHVSCICHRDVPDHRLRETTSRHNYYIIDRIYSSQCPIDSPFSVMMMIVDGCLTTFPLGRGRSLSLPARKLR